jgi:hypothetical protein
MFWLTHKKPHQAAAHRQNVTCGYTLSSCYNVWLRSQLYISYNTYVTYRLVPGDPGGLVTLAYEVTVET